MVSGCGSAEPTDPGTAGSSSASTPDVSRASGPTATGDAPTQPVPDEPHADASITELTTASDTVLRGSVGAVRSGTRIGSDTSLAYTVLTIEPTRTLARTPIEEDVAVAISTASERVPFVVPGRPVPTQGQDGIWFLTRVDADLGFDGYVLTSSAGQVRVDSRGAVIDESSESPAAQEAAELGTAAKVEAVVRKAS